MLHRIIKIFSLACLSLILAVGGVLGWHFFSAQAIGQAYDIGGWYWSDNYGWISLNSGNAEFGEAGDSQAYKAQVDADGNMSGWGWSEHVGWVCFGSTCANLDASFGTAVPSGGWRATINLTTHKIEGWAKILSLTDYGWIRLGMGVATASGQRGEQCYDCQPTCTQWTMSGDPEVPGPPCVTYSTTNFDSCNTCFTRTKFDNVNIPDAGVESVVGGSGNTCFACTGNCQRSIPARSESPITCDSCASCYLYGGASDSQTGGSLGWGWNGNADEASTTGAGWVQFSPANGESGLVYPWIQTQFGAVISSNQSGSFRQKAAVSGINATYCIFAESVYNFQSEKCAGSPGYVSGVVLNFPTKSTADSGIYQNALGKLDIKGLTTKVRSGGGHGYNKYGNIIEEISNEDWGGEINLNNKVYTRALDLVISDPLTIKNGSAGIPKTNGNGLVIVNGDLRIKSNIKYDADGVTDIRQLASVAWIVKGDIIIEPGVREVVGAFVALGKDGMVCSFEQSGEYPKFPRENGCGVFSSGDSANPLVVSGLLLAKAFNFERTYSNIRQGSEKVIYDGRLMANPPPGLKGLMEALPIIRDF